MNIKIIRILVGVVALVIMPAAYADDNAYDVDAEYEDYEVFDDIEDLIDEESYEMVEITEEPAEVVASETETPGEETGETPAPRAVADRLSCDEINTRVEELRADVKSYPELKSDLEAMIIRQRNQCAPRAARRPVHNYKNVNPVMDIDVPEEIMVTESVEPEKTPEEIATEIAAAEAAEVEHQAQIQAQIEEYRAGGLCDDGKKPNKYGCCAGEVFKQLEHLNFACCPKEGDGDCVVPRKSL